MIRLKDSRFRLLLISLLILTLMTVYHESCAQDSEGPVVIRMTLIDDRETAEFWVWGRLLGRMSRGEQDQTFNDAVYNFKKRLDQIFTTKTEPKLIKTALVNGKGVILNGGNQIMVFDAFRAGLEKTPPLKLAERWAGNIRFALKMAGEFQMVKSDVTVPFNESVYAGYRGNLPAGTEFYGFDTGLVRVQQDIPKKRVRITGQSPGKGRIRFKVGGIEHFIDFRVQERAGTAPSTLSVSVCGIPARPDFIRNAMESNILLASNAHRNAHVHIGSPKGKERMTSLQPGQSAVFTVPVRIEGPELIPSSAETKVKIENVRFNQPDPSYLLVSNQPEVIMESGELFNRSFSGGAPVRYFYHHRNACDNPWHYLYISIENKGIAPAKVFVSPIGAGPSDDELFVGHLAMKDYISARKSGEGWFITLKPGEKYILARQMIKTNQTVSGIGYIFAPEPGKLGMCVYSEPVPGKLPPTGVEPEKYKPHVKTSKGVFPSSIAMTPVHEIGGKFTFIYLGDLPYQEDVDSGDPNIGNYGAIYDIDLSIENRWPDERNAWIYFVPGGGVARGILHINDEYRETSLVQAGQKHLLRKLTLSPGETRRVRLRTMPQGGSYYPVKIIVESEYVKNPQTGGTFR